MHLLALFLLAGCDGPDTAPPDPPAPPATPDERWVRAGFEIREGDYLFADLSGCCGPDAYCWGNNPSTPYGMHALPGPPGLGPVLPDILDDLTALGDDLSHTWRLRHDEAVVVLGTLPPPAAYLGYASYLASRPGAPFLVASVGAPVNNLGLADRYGGSPWGQPFALVTTLDAAVERDVEAALLAAGYLPHEIVHDRIPGELVHPGWDAGADTFMSLLRVALYDDPEAGAAYQADPGLRTVRLTPTAERPWTEPHPVPALPPRGTGTDESGLREALDLLTVVLSDAWGDRPLTPGITVPYFPETADCLANRESCAGNLHDRYAAVSLPFTLGPDELVVVHGVNHQRAGKATYASASVQTVDTQTGIAAFTSDRMVGSARTWLPDHPQADDLYAVIFARSCAGLPAPCLEVPFGCPGAEADQPLKITARAYLEPATGAAPLAEELLLDRILKVGAP